MFVPSYLYADLNTFDSLLELLFWFVKTSGVTAALQGATVNRRISFHHGETLCKHVRASDLHISTFLFG